METNVVKNDQLASSVEEILTYDVKRSGLAVLTEANNPEFGNMEIYMIGDVPYFPAAFVASVLGYTNPRKAVRDHVDVEDKMYLYLSDIEGRNGTFPLSDPSTKKVVINESGLYSLMLRSKLDTARRFRRWVTAIVLPSVRKTGAYKKGGDILLPDFSDPAAAARAWADEFEKRRDAEAAAKMAIAEKARAEEKVRFVEGERDAAINTLVEQQPIVETMSNMIPDKGVLVRESFKYMENFGYIISIKKSYDLLHRIGFIFRNSYGRWEPYQDARQAGLVGIGNDCDDENRYPVMCTPVVLRKGFVKIERMWRSDKWRPIFLEYGKEKINYDE